MSSKSRLLQIALPLTAAVVGAVCLAVFLDPPALANMLGLLPDSCTILPAPWQEDGDGEVAAVATQDARAELEDKKGRVRAAVARAGLTMQLEFVEEALSETALVELTGENRVWPEAETATGLGTGLLLAWGVLEEDYGGGGFTRYSYGGRQLGGIGGENLLLVLGPAPKGDQVWLMDASRKLLAVDKTYFYQRAEAACFYVKVTANRLQVPYISQLEAGLVRGCEVTSITMMMSSVLGLADEPLNVHEMVGLMQYSTDGTPATGYVGDPYIDGWTSTPAPQLSFVRAVAGSAQDLSNQIYPDHYQPQQGAIWSSMARLRGHLALGVPVVVWFSGYHLGYGEPDDTAITHCLVLTGFDEGGFYLHDPWNIDPSRSYEDLYYSTSEVYEWMVGHGFWALSC